MHVCIVWGGELEENKTLRIFINNEEKLFYDSSLPSLDQFNFSTQLGGYVYQEGRKKCKTVLWQRICTYHRKHAYVTSMIDNFKIWDKVISEKADFEYNNGMGIEY